MLSEYARKQVPSRTGNATATTAMAETATAKDVGILRPLGAENMVLIWWMNNAIVIMIHAASTISAAKLWPWILAVCGSAPSIATPLHLAVSCESVSDVATSGQS